MTSPSGWPILCISTRYSYAKWFNSSQSTILQNSRDWNWHLQRVFSKTFHLIKFLKVNQTKFLLTWSYIIPIHIYKTKKSNPISWSSDSFINMKDESDRTVAKANLHRTLFLFQILFDWTFNTLVFYSILFLLHASMLPSLPSKTKKITHEIIILSKRLYSPVIVSIQLSIHTDPENIYGPNGGRDSDQLLARLYTFNTKTTLQSLPL